MNNILYHIIVFNNNIKEKIISKFNNIIDMDIINKNVEREENIKNLKKKLLEINIKKKKFEYKKLELKIHNLWNTNFTNSINNVIQDKKNIIMIGMIHNYKTLKKIKFPVKNKFIVKFDIDELTKDIVSINIKNNMNKIITGKYKVSNIDYNYIKEYLDKTHSMYLKMGYVEKSFDEIKNILSLSKNKNKLWYSSADNFRINSNIKNKDKLILYHDPILALLSTIKFKNNEFNYEFINNRVKIQLKNKSSIKKLKTERYIYMLEDNNIVPIDNTSSYTLNKPKIVAKEHIDNIFYKFKDINLI